MKISNIQISSRSPSFAGLTRRRHLQLLQKGNTESKISSGMCAGSPRTGHFDTLVLYPFHHCCPSHHQVCCQPGHSPEQVLSINYQYVRWLRFNRPLSRHLITCRKLKGEAWKDFQCGTFNSGRATVAFCTFEFGEIICQTFDLERIYILLINYVGRPK